MYPVRTGAPRSDYAEVSEAYLVLLNRSHRQQYEEMILRLNPLVVRLELQLMKTVLAGKNLRLEDVIDRPYSRRPRFVPDMLANKLPEVYQSVCTYFGAPLPESDVSMELCYRILEHLPDVPVDAMPVLKSCNLLNESCRNSACTPVDRRDCGADHRRLRHAVSAAPQSGGQTDRFHLSGVRPGAVHDL